MGPVAHAHAVVSYFDDHAIAFELAAQSYSAPVNARLESMLDRVFNERLKQNAGNQDVEGVRIDFLLNVQFVCAEADHFDVQIVIGKAELAAQWYVSVMVFEQGAKNVGELDGHLACELGPGADKRGDRIESVKEKVRIDLPL